MVSTRLRPFHARVGRDALPGQQKAQEVARRDRLDLRPQPLDGVAVNAREQAALAPFLGRRCRREAPAHGEAFGLERRQRGVRSRSAQVPAAAASASRRDRPEAFEPAAQDFDQRLVARPIRAGIRRRAQRSRASSFGVGHSARNCGSRSAVIHSVASGRMRAAPRGSRRGKLRQPVAPAGPGAGFVRAEEAEPDQRVVQLVGIGGVGPCFARAPARSPRDRAGRDRRRSPATSQRRLITAWVRRSSSGASSR